MIVFFLSFKTIILKKLHQSHQRRALITWCLDRGQYQELQIENTETMDTDGVLCL